MTFKQIIIVRKDLGMSTGKIVAQSCHASLGAYLKANEENRDEWESTGQMKIAVKVDSEKELVMLFENAKKMKIPACLIRDAGHTQVEPGSITALGLGPAKEQDLDKLTGHLKLL